MIHFFVNPSDIVYGVQTKKELSQDDTAKLNWLFGNSKLLSEKTLNDNFVGPRPTMITPWSTNAVEITQNMGIQGIIRIEEFQRVNEGFSDFDPMLSQKFSSLTQDIFTINIKPESILDIDDIDQYNRQEGLALSGEEVTYLNDLSKKIGRK